MTCLISIFFTLVSRRRRQCIFRRWEGGKQENAPRGGRGREREDEWPLCWPPHKSKGGGGDGAEREVLSRRVLSKNMSGAKDPRVLLSYGGLLVYGAARLTYSSRPLLLSPVGGDLEIPAALARPTTLLVFSHPRSICPLR